MKSKLYFFIFTGLILSSLSLTAQKNYLKKEKGTTTFMVDNKPFLILGGELHNSTASDAAALPQVFKELKAMNLNTVLTYAYWEFIEPQEGKFNFDLVDAAIKAAEVEDIKLIMVWFGSWKSTASAYVPEWVKTNPKRFPRYTLEDGSTLEMLSAFSEENRKADLKAYVALMNHIKAVDNHNTVIMMQVENEPGCFDNYRDYSKAATKAWQSPMPEQMVSYLKKNKGNLYPELEKNWKANGYKTKGSWEDILGKGKNEGPFKQYTQELFMGYHYSTYINSIAAAGKKIIDLPAFCNGWLYNERGFYPHGTVNPHVLDAYRAGGSALDFYSPNVYTIDYDSLFSKYTLAGNTLFVPESILVPAGALYSIGAYNSIGFAPFGIDGSKFKLPENEQHVALFSQINKTLNNIPELITSNYNSKGMKAVYINQTKKEDKINIGGYTITATTSNAGGFSIDFGKSLEQIGKNKMSMGGDSHGKEEPAPAFSPFGPLPTGLGSAIIIENKKNEFYIIGYGVKLHFEVAKGIKYKHLGFISIDEGQFKNETFIPTKRWNGDEQKTILPDNKLSVLRVKLYKN